MSSFLNHLNPLMPVGRISCEVNKIPESGVRKLKIVSRGAKNISSVPSTLFRELFCIALIQHVTVARVVRKFFIDFSHGRIIMYKRLRNFIAFFLRQN